MKDNMEFRAKVVKSMDMLVYCINNENYVDSWLSVGVADGDIGENTTLQDIIDYGYCEDDNFKDLMTLFLKLMRRAGNNGGLYCDGIVSAERHDEWR